MGIIENAYKCSVCMCFQGNNMDGKELLNVGGTQVTRAFIGVYVFFEMFFFAPR